MCFEVFPNSPAIDIRIDLDDSCNCCYGKNGGNKSNTEMYINREGIAIKFDPKKTNNWELSRMKSYSNLHTIIDQNAEVSLGTKDEFYSYLTDQLFVAIDPEAPTPITLEVVQKINIAIGNIFSLKKPQD